MKRHHYLWTWRNRVTGEINFGSRVASSREGLLRLNKHDREAGHITLVSEKEWEPGCFRVVDQIEDT